MTTPPSTEPGGPARATEPLRLRYAAVSDVGRHRKENQDSGYASEHLLVVADGVGGAAYGDVASSTAVHLLRRLDREGVEEMLPALAGAVHRVHDRLAEMVEEDSELDGTSTTVTAALFDGRRLGFVHIGDSRAYLFRDGVARQVTKDHTFVQTLIDEGRITEEDSRVHPHRNIILRAVDGTSDTDPDLFEVELQPGDRVLLCSDGCSGAVTDRQMGELLARGSVDAAALALVEAALDNGTTDNVTVIVAEAVPAGTTDDPETSAAVTTGPMLVGAAASQPRRGGGVLGGLFRGRTGDTGELDPVPAEDDAPVDPEELRYAPRPPRRRTGLRRVLFVVLPLLLVVGAAVGAYQWSQNQYYVAADGPQVAIYRGVQLDLPGVELSRPYRTAPVQVTDLPPVHRARVEEGIVADDLADARRILDNLVEEACPPEGTEKPAEEPTEEPSRTPDRSASPTARNAADTPRKTPTATPSAEPSASPTAEPDDACDETDDPGTTPSDEPTDEPTASPSADRTGPTRKPAR